MDLVVALNFAFRIYVASYVYHILPVNSHGSLSCRPQIVATLYKVENHNFIPYAQF